MTFQLEDGDDEEDDDFFDALDHDSKSLQFTQVYVLRITSAYV